MKAPILSSWFGRGEIAAPPDIASATLRSDRFRLEREGEWRRLEAIVTRMEKGGLRRIADDDLLALPTLYRTAASSLAVARETSLDAATLAYLEALVQRAWFQVYGPRQGFILWFRSFIFGGWSRAVRSLWLDICIALFVMVAGTVVGWLLVAQDEAWYYRLVPSGLADARVPGASREVLLGTLFGNDGQEWERDTELGYTLQNGRLKNLNLRLNNATTRRSFSSDFDQTRLIVSYPLSL